MTVCIAALAADSKAIVCVADKALTYGGYIQWDADSAKMIPLNPSGTLLMFSGDEEGTSRILGAILASEMEIGAGKAHSKAWLEKNYKEALEELIEIKFLSRRLLNREAYLKAITATEINSYIQKIAREIDGYDANCDILVCGVNFMSEADAKPNSRNTPFLFSMTHPGLITDMTHTGFHAIGSGWERAVSRMLWNDFKRTHPLERVLYDAFDSKASAEMSVGVGYEWDASIVVCGRMCAETVPKKIKQLIERAWAHSTRSPFEKYDPKEDIEPPPQDWKKQLKKYCDSVMQSAFQM